MANQIYDTQTINFLSKNPALFRDPVVKFNLPALLLKRGKQRVAPHSIPTFPTSERKAPFYPGEEPGFRQNDVSVDSIDALFLKTINRIHPSIQSGDISSKKILSALKVDSELMDRFIRELLTRGDLKIKKPCQNPILQLIIRHPDTSVKSTPVELIIGLRDGYQYACDGDCFLPTRKSLQMGGILFERNLITYPQPFRFQGQTLIEETTLEDGQEIKRWSIPLSFEEAIEITESYRQRIE